jgi:hypothetical protein
MYCIFVKSHMQLRNDENHPTCLCQRLQVDKMRPISLKIVHSYDSCIEEIGTRFKQIFDANKEKDDTVDYAFGTERHEIRELTGKKIGKKIYYGGGDPKFSIVKKIVVV